MASFRRAGTTSPYKSVDPAASPATSFVPSSGFDGASRVASSGFGGAFCISLGSNGASCISSPGSDGADPAAPPVSPLRDSVAAPTPAPVRQAAEPLFFRLIHLHLASRRGFYGQHRCCRSCQARRSTASTTVLLTPASAPRRAPTGPSSRFPFPEPFSGLSSRSGGRARGVPPPYHALSSPPPALPLDSGSVSHLRRALTGPSPLFSSPQPFLLPTPALPLDSGSVSHLLRKTVHCGDRS